jgi:hypothetical protein
MYMALGPHRRNRSAKKVAHVSAINVCVHGRDIDAATEVHVVSINGGAEDQASTGTRNVSMHYTAARGRIEPERTCAVHGASARTTPGHTLG